MSAAGWIVLLGVVALLALLAEQAVQQFTSWVDCYPEPDREFDRHVGEALALSREVPALGITVDDFDAWDAELAQHRREWGAK